MYTKEEREEQIRKMQTVTEAFYYAAVRTGVHGYIEFCGLLGEYVKICQRTSDAGVDFNESNTHTGQPLVVADHEVEYLAEKFQCVLGPTLADPKKRAVFFKKMGWA